MTAVPPRHRFLDEIVAGVAARGAHSMRWGSLREGAFPGAAAWKRLQDWCSDNGIDCRMCYSHVSRKADVQFSGHPVAGTGQVQARVTGAITRPH